MTPTKFHLDRPTRKSISPLKKNIRILLNSAKFCVARYSTLFQDDVKILIDSNWNVNITLHTVTCFSVHHGVVEGVANGMWRDFD